MMEKVWEYMTAFIKGELETPIGKIGIIDALDVIILSVILYLIIRFIQNRRAGSLAIGCLLIIGSYICVEALGMRALKYVFSNFYQVGIIALVIIFQDELRTVLEKMGGFSSKVINRVNRIDRARTSLSEDETGYVIAEILKAVEAMSESHTGALIVIEQNTKVGDYITENSGVELDAIVSESLLRNIFVNKAPLHDGAVIIRDMRIAAASCKLPLAERKREKRLGTRHNAAIGISEKASDAIVIVVSEETGKISFCINGELKRDTGIERLENALVGRLINAKRGKKKTNQNNQNPGAAESSLQTPVDNSKL